MSEEPIAYQTEKQTKRYRFITLKPSKNTENIEVVDVKSDDEIFLSNIQEDPQQVGVSILKNEVPDTTSPLAGQSKATKKSKTSKNKMMREI